MTLAGKHPELVVWSSEPLNVETPLEMLARSHVTATELFYVRNHGPVPAVDPAAYRLVVDGMVGTPLALSLEELRGRFETTTVEATLGCAGNRRAELATLRPIEGEIPWGAGAIGTARWTGVRLRDVLRAAEVAPDAGHVAFTGLDASAAAEGAVPFGGSIPLPKALGGDVLLAWAMNGEPLPAAHGFPLRVVVPGYIGARSVKWLAAVTVQADASSNYFQARAYRLFPPHRAVPSDRAADGLELGELVLSSALCRLTEGGSGARVVAEGYAVAGGERTVERVEISPDGGATWTAASLAERPRPGVWRLWRAELELGPGAGEVAVRAWDSAGETQPTDDAGVWNPKGYMNDAWHRVPVARQTV
ncbi:MAG TPA: molybdopterin-dependent oxidoreductase [Gaiellaceae bacterium]|nr:molybdopterin-dependent oxidoreductase [Gaiellaceae bacterium]